jgi:hypothetical protein
MGRTVKTTATTRAVITDRVPTTLTTVYTNNTGRGAELSAVNINGVGDVTNFTTAADGSQWTHFGNDINPYIQANAASGTGFGHPYSVQLSDNRILIFFLPHWQHRGGDGQDYFDGDKVHCQILEYQTNKYVAGPITTVQLPTAPFVDTTYSLWSRPNSMSGAYGNNCWKAVALSETKVAVAYRVRNMFRLVRFTITGNTVDHTTSNLDLTGASFFNTTINGSFAIDTVPGNANKVVIGGDAPTNFSIQAFTVPDTGPLSSATSLTSTGIARSAYHFGMSRMVKTDTANVTPYIIAGATSTTASTAVIFNYNSSADTWTVSGLTTALPAVSSEFTGLECACLSTGTSVNAVIALTGTGAGQTITFCRQTTGAGATNTSTTLTLQHSTAKGITEHYQWGDERAVFIGDAGLLVVYDSAGTATNLLPNTETTNTERWQQQWIPFNVRPLYNLSDNGSIFTERNHQWMSRTTNGSATSTVSPTGTSVGVSTQVGNYFPFGHDYGIGYAWNEPANCWIIGQNGRIYAVDTTGVVLSEIAIYNLNILLNWEYAVRQIGCTPSGRILFACEYRTGVWGGGNYNCWNTWNNWSGIMYVSSTNPITTPTDLSKTTLEYGPSNISMRQTCNLVTFVEQTNATTRTERAVLFSFDAASSPQGYLTGWTAGTGWSNIGNTAISTTTGSNAWFRGYRPNFRLIQDTPASLVAPRGFWRIIGSFAINSSANYRQGGFSNPADINSPGSLATNSNQFDTTQTSSYGYSLGYSSYSSGSRASIQVITMYDQTRGVNRIWTSINGRLTFARGYFPTGLNLDTARRYTQPTATKFGYTVAYQNTDINAGTGIVTVWDTINPFEPRFTLTTTSGNGQIVSYPTGKVSWQNVGAGVNTTYTVGGIPDTVKFFIILDDNSGNTFALNNGQSLDILNIETALYRSEDTYSIPVGYSIKVRSDTPRSISTLLSIRENT